MITDKIRYNYFIQAGDFVKIGFGSDIAARLRQIATHCPYEPKLLFKIPGTSDMEKRLHRRFEHLHCRAEWFRTDPEIFGFIEYLGRMNFGSLHFAQLSWPFKPYECPTNEGKTIPHWRAGYPRVSL